MPTHSAKREAQGGQTLWHELRALAHHRAGETWALSEERRGAIVSEAIEELPDPAKLLLALRYYEGLGVAELSAALGLTADEIHRQLTAALSEVHDILMQAERTAREGSKR